MSMTHSGVQRVLATEVLADAKGRLEKRHETQGWSPLRVHFSSIGCQLQKPVSRSDIA